jgi:peroxidase
MTFPLSERVGENADIDNPMFSNAISAYLDLTQVYGGDVDRNEALRATSGGRMRSQIVDGQEFLPFNDNLPAPVSMAMGNIPNTFAAGDIRANEQVILTAFHTLFLREHNRMADIFTSQGMNNDDAFNAARNSNIAQYQNIVFNEFLPGLLGSDMLPPYSGYDDSINAEVTLAFSTAMYRLGHSGVANSVLAVDSNGQESVRTLADVFFAPQAFLDTNDAVGALLLGSKQTCHERMDPEMQDSLRRLLFANVLDETADLGALNVERARDHQLSSFNDVRSSLGLPDASVNSLSSLTCRQADLNSMFNDISEVPVFVAGLVEDPIGQSQLGETLTAALVDQFSRFRDGDRFHFENRNVDGPGFSDEDLTAIRATRLSDIITQNTFVSADQIGRMAFESEQCCSSGGNDVANMMCVRVNGVVNLQEVDICDVEDMTSSALAFYPGTIDPSDNVFYDCACQAAVVVSSSTSVSATAALVIAAIATLFA